MNSVQRSASSSALVLALAISTVACGGGGGAGGSGGGGNQPPIDNSALPSSVGISHAVAGSGTARVRWTALDPDGQPLAVALFSAGVRANLYAGVPLQTASGNGARNVSGLTNGVELFFGLALDRGAGVYAPIGEVVRVVPRAPIFVDAASTAVAPDGSTPALAFRDPLDGVLQAFSQGGGNVWVAEGVYSDVNLLVWPEVHLAGGFDASFDLAAHDPQLHRSVLRGLAGRAIVEISQGGAGATLDGLELDGRGLAPFGIDIDQTDASIRGTTVENCAGRGLRLRSASLTSATHVTLMRCKVSSNGAEGVSVDGAFDLVVEGSRFASNSFEGFDCDGLVGPDGVAVALDVRDCAFVNNGQEGLDCDLSPPLAPGAGPGRYSVEIQGSLFEGNGRANVANGLAGLNIDIDFELIPNWSAEIVVRGSTARANRGAGVQLDLDSTCSAMLHRVASCANGGDGLRVSSESTPSFVTVSSSAFVGNGGLGLQAVLGQVPLLLSHSIVAGNAAGGVSSSVIDSSASSSIAWMQAAPWSNVRDHFSVEANDALDPAFVRAGVEFYRALSFDGATLALASTLGLQVGDQVELGDDGVLRTITALGAGQRVTLDPNPVAPYLPAGLARFESGVSADEDYRLAPGSPAAAAGMPVVGGPLDAGPFGAPFGGVPGRDDAPRPSLFYAGSSSPSAGRLLSSNQSVRVDFVGGVLDALSVSTQTVKARNASGAALQVGVSVQSGGVVVSAPVGGWPSGELSIELHPGLRSTSAVELAAPIALPFSAP